MTAIRSFSALAAMFLLLTVISAKAQSTAGDEICGKWMSSQKNLLVLVYKDKSDFKGKIIWFKNEDNSKSMEEWTDKHNPDPKLRNRKILGMNVIERLRYDTKNHTWDNGKIYDAQRGRSWDASASLTGDGTLKVTGYWHFKFIGHTMTFNRASDFQAMSTH